MPAKLLARIQALLLRPRDTWRAIAEEPGDARSLFLGYAVWLAAIPAIATFIGTSLVGTSVLGVAIRVPLLTGLVHLSVGYALSLAGVWLLGQIVAWLAPRFGGVADPTRGLKLAVYGATAAWVGGVFAIVPALAPLALLAGLYSLVLLYLGLPLLMQNPPERTLPYALTTLVCAVLMSLAVGFASQLVLPRSALPGVDVSGDAFPQMQQDQSLENLARRAAKAAESGDPEDLAAVMAGAAASVAAATMQGGETSDAQAAAMVEASREALRQAAAAQAQAQAQAQGDANPADAAPSEDTLVPPVPDEPQGVDAVPTSAYGIGKRKLPPPVINRCFTAEEINTAMMGSGCDCSCDGYAAGPDRRCVAACGLSYYACWAPDLTDAELGAKVDDSFRAQFQQLPPADRAAFIQAMQASQMLERAQAWERETLRCP